MHITEGTAALWLAIIGLAGMGALEVFPDRSYIGWVIISVAGLGGYALLCRHASEAFALTWKYGLKSKMIAVFGMILCFIGLLIFTLMFLWTFNFKTVSAEDVADIKSKLDIIMSDFDEYVRPRNLREEQTKSSLRICFQESIFVFIYNIKTKIRKQKHMPSSFTAHSENLA